MTKPSRSLFLLFPQLSVLLLSSVFLFLSLHAPVMAPGGESLEPRTPVPSAPLEESMGEEDADDTESDSPFSEEEADIA